MHFYLIGPVKKRDAKSVESAKIIINIVSILTNVTTSYIL